MRTKVFGWVFISPAAPAAGSKGEPIKRENHRKGSVVNVNPTNIRPHSDTPEIRKYKKKFNTEVLCAGLWGACNWMVIVMVTRFRGTRV